MRDHTEGSPDAREHTDSKTCFCSLKLDTGAREGSGRQEPLPRGGRGVPQLTERCDQPGAAGTGLRANTDPQALPPTPKSKQLWGRKGFS